MRSEQSLALVRTGCPWGRQVRGDAPAAPIRLLSRRAVVVGFPGGCVRRRC